jgi:lipopolysaccharide/colanic/teichoic acid biosynthesis glycosyltransferase
VKVQSSNRGWRLNLLPEGRDSAAERSIPDEDVFCRMIALERKRSERSRKPFLLMLLDMGEPISTEKNGKTLGKILQALTSTTRETDVTGWYKNRSVVGVMFTEISSEERDTIVGTMIARVSETLRLVLTYEQFNQLTVSFHAFPEEWDDDLRQRPSNPTLYPDLAQRDSSRWLSIALKRAMDVVGSMLALLCFSPLFLVIAVIIKVTSKGPVFYRQQRIGQYGKSFVFLKFRSMYVNSDSRIHQEYVTKMIAGKAQANAAEGDGQKVYKLTRDPRITPFGSLLRKTSLDELPQFVNVLRGEMSLVGPRPPVPYEVEAYDIWHRRRLLEAKPGITGLWQVSGRCRLKFDEMVRLDLHYARHWSPWMDIKILARTPGAVVEGEGAF